MTHRQTIALALSLFAAVSLLALHCKKPVVGDPPATPATPSGVTNGGINTSYDFSATTTDSDNDSVCFRFQWGDGATSDWSDWVASGETATTAHQWASPNTYQVKTQAKDRPGSTSEWSATLAVTITSNRPPNTPAIPTGPSSAPKDSGCYFTSISNDPDGDGVSYRFDWGNGDTSDWTQWVPSGYPGGAMQAYPCSGTFQVRAQARDANEARSAWSYPQSVTIYIPAGTLEWRYQTGSWVESSPAIAADGTIYVGSYDDYLYAINPSGTLKWRYQTGSYVTSSPAVAADGTVYVGSNDGYLYAVSPAGALKWRYQTGDGISSSPAIAADGTVYVGSGDGYLYAIWAYSPQAGSAWPKFHHDNKNTGRVGGGQR